MPPAESESTAKKRNDLRDHSERSEVNEAITFRNCSPLGSLHLSSFTLPLPGEPRFPVKIERAVIQHLPPNHIPRQAESLEFVPSDGRKKVSLYPKLSLRGTHVYLSSDGNSRYIPFALRITLGDGRFITAGYADLPAIIGIMTAIGRRGIGNLLINASAGRAPEEYEGKGEGARRPRSSGSLSNK